MQEKVKETWKNSDDRDKVNYSMVPIVVLCNKFDGYVNSTEIRMKKMMSMALRYIAHTNTCDLVFGSVKDK